MTQPTFTIFAVSDATGEQAKKLVERALLQFQGYNVKIRIVPKVNNEAAIEDCIKKAKECQGIIAFTLVAPEMREMILDRGKKQGVVVIDILGPVLGALSNYFHVLPSAEPGLQYKLTEHYFKRTDALEFAVKHDDGLGLDAGLNADVLILGVSRTSKTPLSIFMAYHGYRCANIPVVNKIPVPAFVREFPKNKIVGLTIAPQKLMMIRAERLKKLGRPENESYAQLENIRDEISYAGQIFKELGIYVVDVTGKAIEETATDIINQLKL